MGKLDDFIASMETKIDGFHEVYTVKLDQISEDILEGRKDLREFKEKIVLVLFGNGKNGLVTQVALLKQNEASDKRRETVVTTLIASIVGGIITAVTGGIILALILGPK